MLCTCMYNYSELLYSITAVYSSINETVDATKLVEDGYYASPKTADKVRTVVKCYGPTLHTLYTGPSLHHTVLDK